MMEPTSFWHPRWPVTSFRRAAMFVAAAALGVNVLLFVFLLFTDLLYEPLCASDAYCMVTLNQWLLGLGLAVAGFLGWWFLWLMGVPHAIKIMTTGTILGGFLVYVLAATLDTWAMPFVVLTAYYLAALMGFWWLRRRLWRGVFVAGLVLLTLGVADWYFGVFVMTGG